MIVWEDKFRGPRGPRLPIAEYLETYETVSWVLVAMRQLARGMARPKLKTVDAEGREAPNHALARLLHRVNPRTSWRKFLFADTSWRMLAGFSIWEWVPDMFGLPKQIYHVHPTRVQIEVDPVIGPVRYHVWEGRAKKRIIPAQRILHRVEFSTEDEYFGLSRIRALARGVNTDVAMERWTEGTFKNGVKPHTFITPREGEDLSTDEMRRIRNEAKREAGTPDKKGEWVVLPQDVNVHRIPLNFEEIQLLEGRKFTKEQIGMVFGVWPALMGSTESVAFSNTEGQMSMFHGLSIIPDAWDLVDEINEFIAPHFDRVPPPPGSDFTPPVRVTIDPNSILSLTESKRAIADVAHLQMQDGIVTRNEARMMQGLEPLPDPNMDVVYAPLNYVPLDQLSRPTPAPPPGGMGGQTPGLVQLNPTQLNLDVFRMAHMKRASTEEAQMRREIGAVFEKWARTVKSRLEQGARAADALPERDALARDLQTTLERESVAAMARQVARQRNRLTKSAADDLIDELGRLDPTILTLVNRNSPIVQEVLGVRMADNVRNVSDHLIEALRAAIVPLTDSGADFTTIVRRIDEIMVDSRRSETIARQEVATALNSGSALAFESLGVQRKGWLTLGFGERRENHLAQERSEPVPFESVFPLTGLRWPHDPTGPASEVIECKCSLLPEVGEDDLRAMQSHILRGRNRRIHLNGHRNGVR